MKVLVACECSGVVRRAFAARGHDAWSVDLRSAYDASPRHICGDALEIMRCDSFDLIIAHPPCTYLSVSGMHWTTRGLRDPKLTEDALRFFVACLEAPCPRVCVENPVGITSTRVRPPDQWIQPYEFGDDASKRTGLWLRGLPKLVPTCRVPGRMVNGRERWSNQTDSGQNRLGPSERRAAERAQTYAGVAAAMAEQWNF